MADVELVPDDRGGVTVLSDGHPQSHVCLADPGLLAFEYVQHLGCLVDAMPPGRLAVTHVGGGGLTLARYVQHTRPGSPQIVFEPDAALTETVRRELPLPRGHRIRVRPLDGAQGVAGLRDASADLVVVDAYAGGRVPASLTTPSFAAGLARVLAPGGVVALNLADEPGLRFVARMAATLRTPLPVQSLVGTHEVLKGRRFGNSVLVATREPAAVERLDLPRHLARSPFPTGVWGPSRVARWSAGAVPFDEAGGQGPQAPDPGRWRLV